MVTRRHFCRSAAAAAFISSRAAFAAVEYDLLIRGGRVLDPGRGIDGRLDVAVRGGHIVALRRELPRLRLPKSSMPKGGWWSPV